MSNAIKVDEFGMAIEASTSAIMRWRLSQNIAHRIEQFTLRQGKACTVFVTITAPEEIDETPHPDEEA